MGSLRSVCPKNFLCHFSLKIGSYVAGTLMGIICICNIIASLVQAMNAQKCEACPAGVTRINQGYCITSVVYSVLMLIITLLLFYGIHKGKAGIVGGYVAISLIWFVQSLTILLVLIFLYSAAVSVLSWVLALIFGLVALAIVLYLLLVTLGYYFQLKTPSYADGT